MEHNRKESVYIIEPHPDDALGSASGLIYSFHTEVSVCTLTRTKDERDKIDLTECFRSMDDVLRKPPSIVRQIKYDLDDLHWDLRGDNEEDYQDAVRAYEELYGDLHRHELKRALSDVITRAFKEKAAVAFPLGLLHPMHVLVSAVMLECIREMRFPADDLWIYVDHPYDVFCIGTRRMSQCIEYIREKLGVSLRRYDLTDIDQNVTGEALRTIYGDVHHAEFSDVFRKTFCSFYVTEKRKEESSYLKMKSSRVLFITDQSLPYYKRGGLGDVSFSYVQAALNYADHICIMMPMRFRGSLPGHETGSRAFHYRDAVGRELDGSVRTLEYRGIIFYLIDVPRMEWDRTDEYAVMADMMISRIFPILDFEPDILHCNDWQTGFIPFLLKTKYSNTAFAARVKTLYTIHSYGYQGICNKKEILKMTGLDKEHCRVCPVCVSECPLDQITYLGEDQQKVIGTSKPISASFMKAGIYFSDKVSTVSRGYARELEHYPELKGISVTGIRNGIGPETASPSDNRKIICRYSSKDIKSGKAANKKWFQQKYGLEENPKIPVFCIVSRLSKVKGMDDIVNIIDLLLELQLQLIIVGNDDKGGRYAEIFKKVMEEHKGRFLYAAFSPELEFQVYAAADILLMPSLSESCGMTQILAMHYGVIPVVTMVSGFQDTVTSIEEEVPDKGVGYRVYADNCWMLLEAVMVILEDFKDKNEWNRLAVKNMITDFRWENGSLKKYMELYHELL